MWDKLLGNWVEKHLGTYFKNLDVHKFRLDLGKGDLKLGPLELRPEVLSRTSQHSSHPPSPPHAPRRAPPAFHDQQCTRRAWTSTRQALTSEPRPCTRARPSCTARTRSR